MAAVAGKRSKSKHLRCDIIHCVVSNLHLQTQGATSLAWLEAGASHRIASTRPHSARALRRLPPCLVLPFISGHAMLAFALLLHLSTALASASAPPLPVAPLVDGAALAPPNADGVRQWVGKKTLLSWSPRAFHLAAFLTATERAHMVALAAPQMRSSYVLDPKTSKLVPSQDRTSRGAWLPLGATDTVLGVERRLELLLDLPMVHQEATQVLAYGPGERTCIQHRDGWPFCTGCQQSRRAPQTVTGWAPADCHGLGAPLATSTQDGGSDKAMVGRV